MLSRFKGSLKNNNTRYSRFHNKEQKKVFGVFNGLVEITPGNK